ncbi:MAG: ribosome silencing factor [Planctomycetes bacterium]|nr:ribosome silencing factor [Planctomycetota bacterium]
MRIGHRRPDRRGVDPERPTPSQRRTPIANARDLALACARVADAKKAENIVVLDIKSFVFLTDYFVVASGRNRKQLQAIADEILRTARQSGLNYHHVEGYQGGTWICVDLGDVVCHLFQAELREFYELESLWSEAKKVRWSSAPTRKAPKRAAAAGA